MMNFSAFGGPFSGIHQFAAKFDAQTPGAFGTPPAAAANAAAAAAAAGTDNHVQRYQTNGNHFNQNVPNGKCICPTTTLYYTTSTMWLHIRTDNRLQCTCRHMCLYNIITKNLFYFYRFIFARCGQRRRRQSVRGYTLSLEQRQWRWWWGDRVVDRGSGRGGRLLPRLMPYTQRVLFWGKGHYSCWNGNFWIAFFFKNKLNGLLIVIKN